MTNSERLKNLTNRVTRADKSERGQVPGPNCYSDLRRAYYDACKEALPGILNRLEEAERIIGAARDVTASALDDAQHGMPGHRGMEMTYIQELTAIDAWLAGGGK